MAGEGLAFDTKRSGRNGPEGYVDGFGQDDSPSVWKAGHTLLRPRGRPRRGVITAVTSTSGEALVIRHAIEYVEHWVRTQSTVLNGSRRWTG